MPKTNPWIDLRVVEEMIAGSRMSEESARRIRHYARLYADFLESRGTPFEMADHDDLKLFYEHLMGNYSGSTAGNALNTAKRLHRWVEGSPIERVGKDVPRPSRTAGEGVRKALSPGDVRAVMAACETKREAALISLLLESALKPGEVHAANVGDVTFLEDCAVMVVSASRSRPESLLRIPMTTAIKLQRYLEARRPESPEEPLFTSQSTRSRGARLSYRSIREIVQEIFARADIPGAAGEYDMRKSAMLLARDMGADDEEILRFARLRSMGTLKDADNLFRYAADGPQERLSRALNGAMASDRICVAKVLDIRRMLSGFRDDDLVVVYASELSGIGFDLF